MREVFATERSALVESGTSLSIQFLFLGSNHCCSPNVLADVAAKRFFQIRNNTVANPIPHRREIFVGRVFAKFQPMFAHIVVDFSPPD